MSDTTTTTDTDDAATTTTDARGGGEDVAGLKSALDAERTGRKTAEKEWKTLQTRLKALEDKDKSDLERITGERDTLKADYEKTVTDLRSERAARLVTSAATKANAIRPDAIYRLINGGLEYGDDGQPTNVEAAVASVKKDYPELFQAGAGSGDGGRGGGDTPKDGNAAMNLMIRRAAGRTG